jgi:hypothetical protein
MKKVTIKDLISALESGQYTQMTGYLGWGSKSRCCIGVLCETAEVPFTRTVKKKKEQSDSYYDYEGGDLQIFFPHEDDSAYRPDTVHTSFVKDDSAPAFAPWLTFRLQYTLMALNDQGGTDYKYPLMLLRLLNADGTLSVAKWKRWVKVANAADVEIVAFDLEDNEIGKGIAW